jgi:hypothetical protein
MRHQSTVYFMLVFAHEAILLVRFSSWWNIEKRFSSTESWYFHAEIFSSDFQHDEVKVFRQYLNHQYFCSSLSSQSYSSIHSSFLNHHERVYENYLNHVNKYSDNHFLIYSYSIHKQINRVMRFKDRMIDVMRVWNKMIDAMRWNEIIRWWKIAKCNDDECKQTSFHCFVVINIIHWRDWFS